MGFLYYNKVQKTSSDSSSKYPSWIDASPNLITYLDSINLSQPIIQCQYELVMSRWPRTLFFAKNVTIPEITTNTIEINHAGFTIPIATHTKYGSNEISFTIIADKEGLHYYDWRNMVFQSGHPLVAGDTMSTISSNEYISDEDILEIRLRNSTEDDTHHHWLVHNFRPTKVGSIEMAHDSSSFVTFEVTGTFTHIDYDSGSVLPTDVSSIPEDQTWNNQEQAVEEPETQPPDETPTVVIQWDVVEEPEPLINYDDLSEDEKMVVDKIQELGKDNPTVKAQVVQDLAGKYPDETDEEIEERAEDAISKANKFVDQQTGNDWEYQSLEEEESSSQQHQEQQEEQQSSEDSHKQRQIFESKF